MSPPVPQSNGLLDVALVDIEVAAGGLVVVPQVVGQVPTMMVGGLGYRGRVVLWVVLYRTGWETPGGGGRHGERRVAHDSLSGRGHR